ncbi:MAG: protein kinase, partial [Gemmatimonadetes bacterium]|nr:protein kinase [Gemmatimonadota bacterium]
MIGKKLAHYEVIEKIGAGGMGEVWLVRDTKLDRNAAIKVLPAEFAADPERLARFEREAKFLASLNHPNVASIYGLEHDSGIHFLVLEHIEGDSLNERVKQGPIPVRKALDVALQFAISIVEVKGLFFIHRVVK